MKFQFNRCKMITVFYNAILLGLVSGQVSIVKFIFFYDKNTLNDVNFYVKDLNDRDLNNHEGCYYSVQTKNHLFVERIIQIMQLELKKIAPFTVNCRDVVIKVEHRFSMPLHCKLVAVVKGVKYLLGTVVINRNDKSRYLTIDHRVKDQKIEVLSFFGQLENSKCLFFCVKSQFSELGCRYRAIDAPLVQSYDLVKPKVEVNDLPTNMSFSSLSPSIKSVSKKLGIDIPNDKKTSSNELQDSSGAETSAVTSKNLEKSSSSAKKLKPIMKLDNFYTPQEKKVQELGYFSNLVLPLFFSMLLAYLKLMFY